MSKINNVKQSVKTHVTKHKAVYIVGGTCLAVGVSVGFALKGVQNVTVDKYNIKIKSPTTNNVTTILVRRGHPGNIIRCNETGEVFASQNRAAEALGLSASNLSKHLKGVQPSVSGYTFENLGEAA